MLLGERQHRLDRLGAQAARRGVEHAQQAHLIGGIVDQAQVGDQVLDLAPAVETLGADQAVGEIVAEERLLQRARLGVGAVHDGHIAQAPVPRRDAGDERLDDVLRLIRFVVRLVDGDELALAAIGEQPLARPSRLPVDHPHGGIQDGLRRAVVLLEQEDLSVRVVLLEAAHVANVGAAPTVDRLIGIADRVQVGLIPCQVPQPLILDRVGVLELVDEQVREAAPVGEAHVLMVAQQAHGAQEQVVEVEGVVLQQQLLVALIGALGHFTDVAAGGEVLRFDQLVLGPRDQRQHLARGDLLRVEVHLLEALADERELVGVVEDDEVAAKGEPFRLAAQHAGAQGVEGAQADRLASGRRSDQNLEPGAHGTGGLVGERHCHDLGRGDVEILHQIGNPVCEDARLSGPGSGKDENRPGRRGDRLALLGIQSFEQVHGRMDSNIGRGSEGESAISMQQLPASDGIGSQLQPTSWR